MTEKQINILHSALHLFANQGYNNVSTAKIALHAQVSEGLIFKHFKSKLGLLEAVLHTGYQKLEVLLENVSLETDPREKIKMILSIPFNIPESDYPYWRLIYALKWQQQNYNKAISVVLSRTLKQCFKELKYSKSKYRTEIALLLLDGLATRILLGETQINTKKLKKEILKKVLQK